MQPLCPRGRALPAQLRLLKAGMPSSPPAPSVYVAQRRLSPLPLRPERLPHVSEIIPREQHPWVVVGSLLGAGLGALQGAGAGHSPHPAR